MPTLSDIYQLCWVIRDFAVKTSDRDIIRYHTDQIIQVPKNEIDELEKNGFVIPIFLNMPYFYVTYGDLLSRSCAKLNGEIIASR